ncbi:MAG: hypothetical protein ACXIU8_09750 [Alkalilacustris sp.]
MLRTSILSLVIAGFAGWAGPSLAAGAPIASVDIESGVVELQGSEAGGFWADLDEDLASALDARLEDRFADAGAHVRVRIDRLSLNNAYELMQADGVPVLEGRVTVVGPMQSDSQLVRVSAEEGATGDDGAADGVDARYSALIEAFADGVVAMLE